MMAINYGYGIDPNQGALVNSLLAAEEKKRKAEEIKAFGKVNAEKTKIDAFNQMFSQLASAGIGVAKEHMKSDLDGYTSDHNAAVDQAKHQRNQYQTGTDEYNFFNERVTNLNTDFRNDVKKWKESGYLNRDGSLLSVTKGETGGERTFTGLSEGQQGLLKHSNSRIKELREENVKLEKGIQARKSSLEKIYEKPSSTPDVFTGEYAMKDIQERWDSKPDRDKIAGNRSMISSLGKTVSGVRDQGQGVLEDYDFDPATGKELKRSSLKLHEQRRYQEAQRSNTLEGQAAGLLVRSGITPPDNLLKGSPYGMMTKDQLEAVMIKGMEPELLKQAQFRISNGISFDKENKEHQQIADSYGMNFDQLQNITKHSAEAIHLNRLNKAGTDYNAIEKYGNEAINSGYDFTTVTPEHIQGRIDDAKSATRNSFYAKAMSIANTGNLEFQNSWYTSNENQINKYIAEGVLCKDFKAASSNYFSGKAKNTSQRLHLNNMTTSYNLVGKAVEISAVSREEIPEEVKQIAANIGIKDIDALVQDEKAKNDFERSRKEVTAQNSRLTLAKSLEKEIYERMYGTGQGVTSDGRGGLVIYDKGGLIDIDKTEKNLLTKTNSTTGDLWTKEDLKISKESWKLHNALQTSILQAKQHGVDVKGLQTTEEGRALLTSTDWSPNTAVGTVQVRQGDTLSKIAKRHDTTVAELQRLNPQIENKDKIETGQRVVVPTKRRRYSEFQRN